MIRIVVLTFIYATFALPAQAYIDAAIGSLLLQGLAAGFFTFMVMWRNGIETVKRFYRKMTGQPEPVSEDQQTDSVE